MPRSRRDDVEVGEGHGEAEALSQKAPPMEETPRGGYGETGSKPPSAGRTREMGTSVSCMK